MARRTTRSGTICRRASADWGSARDSRATADQIAGTDVLTLTFTSQVKLTGIATLYDDPHNPFGTGFSNKQSIIDNAASIVIAVQADSNGYNNVSLDQANKNLLTLSGTTFSFMEATNNPEFYISAIAFDTCGGAVSCGPPPTPLPAALPLFVSGLGASARSAGAESARREWRPDHDA